MPVSRKITTAAVAAFMVATPLLAVAQSNAAETKNDPVATATAKVANKGSQLLKTSNEAYRALREVRAARLSIFNGDSNKATKFTNDAEKALLSAQKNAAGFAVSTNKGSKSGEIYIPFDMSMSLAEGFVATPEKAKKLKEANAHIANGKSKKAAEVLKLANIDVTVTAALVPIGSSVNHMRDAVALIKVGKFYEANRELKAVEESVIIDSYGIDTVPVQGSNS